MKINASYWKDNADDKKDSRADWIADARRNAVRNESDAALKHKQTEPLPKEETKFIGILESAAKPQKTKRTPEDTGEQRRDDDKKDKKTLAREKDSSETRSGNDRIERNQTSYGGQFGGSGGFGGGDISQTIHLSENFAARSILHIADLERMISAIRSQSKPGGKREILLKLNRSVLEGLQVKITSGDAAQVQIEFLAANEKIRSQIENHSEELAEILRGRGVNLQSLRAAIVEDSPSFKKETVVNSKDASNQSSNSIDDTFEAGN
jgi:Flagellar hook-length control protein FliK